MIPSIPTPSLFVDYDLSICDMILRDPTRLAVFEKSKVSPDMLIGDGKIVFDFIRIHFGTYGKVPDSSTIFATTNISWNFEPKEPFVYYLDQVFKRHTLVTMGNGIQSIHSKLRQMNSELAVQECKDLAYSLDRMQSRTKLDLDYSLTSGLRWEKYLSLASNKTGLVGLPLPWPSINLVTGGVESSDLFTIVGRTGLGKTWLLCYICAHIMKMGFKTLIVSKEIATNQMALRIDSILTSLPYDSVRRGMLSDIGEKARYEKYLADVCSGPLRDKLIILSSTTVDTVEDLDFKIAEYKPDMVFVDGVYIMRSSNHKLARHEQREDVIQGLKFTAQKFNTPILVTTQFNRSAAGKAAERLKGGVESVGGSDAFGQWSDTMIGIYQNSELEKNNRMIIRIIKNRNGLKGEDVPLFTNFTSMEFSELQRNISMPVLAGGNKPPAEGFHF